MTIFESIKQMQRVINQANLSPSTVALASMQSGIAQQFNQINGMNELLFGVTKTAFQQTEQINKLFASTEFQRQMESINKLSDTVLQSTKSANLQFAKAMSILDNPTIKSQLEQMSKTGKLFEQVNNSALMQIARTFEAYNSPAIKMQLENLQAISQTTLSAISQSVTAFDFSDIQFNDNGSLVYEGVEYSQEAIEEEFHLQVKVAESNPICLKESVDKLKEKYWLIGLIISLLLFLPQLPQTIDFYRGIITQVYQAINEVNPVCYVVKERAYLREEANVKSKIVAKLVYDTTLEVLNTIPRWIRVKYTDEDGNEQIGWISKISVEEEEPQNDQ